MTLRRFITVVVPLVAVVAAMFGSLVYERNDARVAWTPVAFERGVFTGPVVGVVTPRGFQVAWETIEEIPSGILLLDATHREVVRRITPRGRQHEVKIQGLAPGRMYRYRLLGPEGALSDRLHPIRTAPASPTAPVYFVAMGDSGSGTPAQLRLARRLHQEPFDFLLHTGDTAYNHGTRMQVRHRFVGPYARLMASRPFYVSVGNHDLETDGGSPLFDALPMPRNDVDGSERYYHFEYGCVRVVCLDSQAGIDAPDTPQLKWLDRILGAPTETTWTVVIAHEPTHAHGAYSGHPDMQAHVAPILERHGVDLVFAGDDHNYQRTLPMRGNERAALEDLSQVTKSAGTTYIVTAGGGKNLYALYEPNPLAAGIAAFHFVTVDATPERLRVRAIGSSGEVYDRFTLSSSTR